MTTYNITDLTKNQVIVKGYRKLNVPIMEQSYFDTLRGLIGNYYFIRREIHILRSNPSVETTLAHELSHAISHSLGLFREDRFRKNASRKQELRIEEGAAEIVTWLVTAKFDQKHMLMKLRFHKIKPSELGIVGLERASKIYQFLTGNPLERTVVRNALRTLLSVNQQPKAVSYSESLFAKV